MTYMCSQETKKLSNNFENFRAKTKDIMIKNNVFAIAPYQKLC